MRRVFVPFVVIIICIGLCGCHSLRKKFVRKKKYHKEDPVYVDFKEYDNTISPQAYSDYHVFVRGWIDELISALNKGMSFKRQKRAIDEIIMNMEQMMAFYNQEGKNTMYPLYEDFLAVRDDVQRSPNMSEMQKSSLIHKLKHYKRRFETEFNYSDAQAWIEM